MSMRGRDEKDLLEGTWWFPLRKYLPGWGLPVCWQGWAVLGGYVGLLGAPLPLLARRFAPYYAAYAVVLTVTLMFVISKKGERPR
jgi:hypothetical protein